MDNHAGETLYDGFPVAYVASEFGASPSTPRRTLAIVGSHPASLHLVPWDDPNVEIMVFNEAAQKTEKYPRWDILLQIHSPEVYTSPFNWVNREHWTWLQQKHGKPIYMQAVDTRVPDSVEYPLEGVLSLAPYRYLRSSPAMALALGIYQGYERIELYGSELSSNTEYAYQATNYAFWIGLAHGRGIDLRLNCWHSEFFQPIYGFDGEFDVPRYMFSERFKMHEVAWNESERTLYKMRNNLDAAMLRNDYQEVGKISLEMQNAAMVAGEASGAMSEAKAYAERTNPISRQEFEKRAAQAQIDGEKLLKDTYHAGGKTEYVWNIWAQSGKVAALNQLREFIRGKTQLAYDTGARVGAYRENIHYMTEYDKLITAAGGVRALGRKSDEAALVAAGGR